MIEEPVNTSIAYICMNHLVTHMKAIYLSFNKMHRKFLFIAQKYYLLICLGIPTFLKTGRIFCDILDDKWTPVLTMSFVLMSLVSLLSEDS